MKHLLRLALVVVMVCWGGAMETHAQRVFTPLITPVIPTARAAVTHTAPGYLGVVCANVDPSQASTLNLKSISGVEVLEVDRDAPAGKAGIRPHDVLLKMDGHVIASGEQLRRTLAATPPGATVTLLVSRDGRQRTVSLRLANRVALERNAWSPVLPIPEEDASGHLPGRGFANSFLGVFGLGSPTVGVNLDALGPQLADYFGVSDGQGLLVKRVVEDSPASRAGIRAGDVIIAVNGRKVATLSDWVKLMHANRGKPMKITFVRDRKQQTTTMLTRSGRSEWSAPPAGPLFHAVSTAG